MTKIAIAGAAGRMGQALIRCAARENDLKVVAAVEQKGNPAIGKDAGSVAGAEEIGVRISDDPRSIAGADVLIDFTAHDAVPGNARLAVDLGIAVVIGTTGLNDGERAAVEKAANRIPIVWAPNMSLGVNLLFSVVNKAAAVLGAGYGVEIDETHHVHKKDAPSGTALRLGEKVAEGREQDLKKVMVHETGTSGARHPGDKIVIRSHREGEVVGDHTVRFGNDAETVEFTHHALSRDAFALGALRAAQWVASRRPRLYDMQDVLGL